MNKDDQKPLIQKKRDGIIKSGFPLEMKAGNILDENNWKYRIGGLYKDFETGKTREYDILHIKRLILSMFNY